MGKNLKSIGKKYSAKRAELKKAFYSLKKQGFADGNYKDTKEYKNLIKAEKSAIYRYKNADTINQRRRQKRAESKNTIGLRTETPIDAIPAFKAFAGGKNSSYFKLINSIIKGRAFYGFIEIIKNEEDNYPDELATRINNPYLSVPGYYKKVREIIDFIQADTEREYLWLSVICTIKISYDANKIIVTHIFDFSNA